MTSLQSAVWIQENHTGDHVQDKTTIFFSARLTLCSHSSFRRCSSTKLKQTEPDGVPNLSGGILTIWHTPVVPVCANNIARFDTRTKFYGWRLFPCSFALERFAYNAQLRPCSFPPWLSTVPLLISLRFQRTPELPAILHLLRDCSPFRLTFVTCGSTCQNLRQKTRLVPRRLSITMILTLRRLLTQALDLLTIRR